MADSVERNLRSLVFSADEVKEMTGWPDAMIEEWLNNVNNFSTLAQGVDSKTVTGTENQIVSTEDEGGGVTLSIPDPFVSPGDIFVTGKLLNVATLTVTGTEGQIVSTEVEDGVVLSTPDPFIAPGDTHIKGDIVFLNSGSGLAYGSLYAKEASLNVDISTAGQGVFVKIAGLTTGLLNNVSVNSDAFNVAGVGVYKVDWQASVESGQNEREYQFSIFVDGVEQADGSARKTLVNDVLAQIHILSGTGLINVTNATHDIDLRVEQVNSSPSDLDVKNLNFNITQLGG